MPLGPLGVTALLVALDWGAWEWATSANHPTVGVIAGLLMAPLAVAFAWSLIRVLVAGAERLLRRASAHPNVRSAQRAGDDLAVPFDIEADGERIAA